MDLNQIFRLLRGRFMRKLMNRGLNAGIDYAARRGKAPADMTPEEKASAANAKKMAKTARKAARLGRRSGRL